MNLANGIWNSLYWSCDFSVRLKLHQNTSYNNNGINRLKACKQFLVMFKRDNFNKFAWNFPRNLNDA